MSILVSLLGFLIVAGALLVQGECILTAAIRAIIAFIALWAVQTVLRALLSLTNVAEPANTKEPSDERQ